MYATCSSTHLACRTNFYFVRSSDKRKADCEDRVERYSRSRCDGGHQFPYVWRSEKVMDHSFSRCIQVFDRKSHETKHGLDNPSITENCTMLRNVPACEEEEGGGRRSRKPFTENKKLGVIQPNSSLAVKND